MSKPRGQRFADKHLRMIESVLFRSLSVFNMCSNVNNVKLSFHCAWRALGFGDMNAPQPTRLLNWTPGRSQMNWKIDFQAFCSGRFHYRKVRIFKNNYPKWPTTGPYGPFRSVGRGAIQAGDDGRWPIAAHHYTIRTVGVTSTNDIERSTVTQEKTKHANASNRWHRILKYVNPCWTELLYSLLVNM